MKGTLAVVLACAMAAPLAAAKDKEVLRLRAFAVDLNNGARTGTVDIVVERWSTPEEESKLKSVFVEQGREKLLTALQKVRPRCGFVRGSNTLGWDIYYAREMQEKDGSRRIFLASDRPMSMWELRNSGRSTEYEFSLVEIHLGKDGKGQGKAIAAAKLELDPDTGVLEIENYQREPVRLNDVTVVPSK
jgi:hypothetical protein